MNGVILGGGIGARLKPLTDDKPKVMLEIGGRPVLEGNLNILKNAGILDIIVTLFHKPEAVTGYFRTGAVFGTRITYSLQDKLLGTAGDIRCIKAGFKSTFTVVYGDNFSNCDLRPVLERHKSSGAMATLVLFDRQNNSNSGIAGGRACLAPGTHRVINFTEGQGEAGGYVNAGIYVLEPEILCFIPENTVYDFGRDLFPRLIREKKDLHGYLMPCGEYLFGLDTAEHYKRAEAFCKERAAGGRVSKERQR